MFVGVVIMIRAWLFDIIYLHSPLEMSEVTDTCSLLDLPLELVEVIVTHPCLALTDIAHLCAACTAVNVIVSRSWKKIALGK